MVVSSTKVNTPPLISKDLFLQTQEALKRNTFSVHGSEPKDFAFTKLLVCGKCGSGITAEEKTKKQKNGNTHHYIYYSCCGSKDRKCKKSFLEEKDLVKQLIARIDTLPLDTSKITQQFKEEIARFNRFQKMLGIESHKSTPELDTKKYLVYLLKEGTTEEKRLVAGFVMEKLVLRDKVIEELKR